MKTNKLRVFSIISAALFLCLAAFSTISMVINFVTPIISAIMNGVPLSLAFNYLSLLGILRKTVPSIVGIVLEILAAVLLFVKPRSKAVFIPIGLLTYTFFSGVLSFFGALLLHGVIAGFGEETYATATLIMPLVYLVLSLACAAVLTLIFVLVANKKNSFALMLVMTAIFVLGILVCNCLNGASIVINIGYLTIIDIIPSMLSIVILSLKFIPVAFAAIGMFTPKTEKTIVTLEVTPIEKTVEG